MTTHAFDLDARLRQHHLELVRSFAAAPARTAARPVPRRRAARRLLWAGAVAAVLAVTAPVVSWRLLSGSAGTSQVQVAGFTLTVGAVPGVSPRMTKDEAITVVKRFLTDHELVFPDGQKLDRFTVTGATYVPNVDRVTQPCVHVAIPSRENLWVVTISAPNEGVWTVAGGGFLVNDANGSLAGGDVLIDRIGARC